MSEKDAGPGDVRNDDPDRHGLFVGSIGYPSGHLREILSATMERSIPLRIAPSMRRPRETAGARGNADSGRERPRSRRMRFMFVTLGTLSHRDHGLYNTPRRITHKREHTM